MLHKPHSYIKDGASCVALIWNDDNTIRSTQRLTAIHNKHTPINLGKLLKSGHLDVVDGLLVKGSTLYEDVSISSDVNNITLKCQITQSDELIVTVIKNNKTFKCGYSNNRYYLTLDGNVYDSDTLSNAISDFVSTWTNIGLRVKLFD